MTPGIEAPIDPPAEDEGCTECDCKDGTVIAVIPTPAEGGWMEDEVYFVPCGCECHL